MGTRRFVLAEWRGHGETVLCERIYDDSFHPFIVRYIRDSQFTSEKAARDYCEKEYPGMTWTLYNEQADK